VPITLFQTKVFGAACRGRYICVNCCCFGIFDATRQCPLCWSLCFEPNDREGMQLQGAHMLIGILGHR
jgi:hypothetical protein